MAVIENLIKIGSEEDPAFTFDNGDIDLDSIDIAEDVDLVESELSIDVFNFVVKYVQGNGEDLRAVPYGTPVFHYVSNSLARKYYIKTIQRIARDRYRINTVSAVGILSKQYHKGGVYLGITFADLMQELIGDSIPYTYDPDVGATQIFGWLPYATKRENLHQVLFAENISLVKNASGDPRFVFLELPGEAPIIPQNRLFLGGSIDYPSIATRVQLTEHSYQQVDTIERVTLVDNSDKAPATTKLFVFNTAPIVVSTLQASAGLTIVEAGVNYAILTGQGVLTGVPYYDKTAIVERTYNSGGEAYSVSVETATLVTGINSENVADRLLSYYTSSETVRADLKVSGEKCGEVYSFTDMYGDPVRAFLSKMETKISSLVRAACQFICGYSPETFGNNYTHWASVEHNGWISIPEGTTIARFVIIGGGDGGSSGLRGADDNQDLYAGSIGGEPGSPGKGGYIREVILHNPTAGRYICAIGEGGKGGAECESVTSRNLATAGTETTVTTPNGVVYSSNHTSSYRSTNGIKNLFTETVYAKTGKPGAKGGNGGRGSVSGNGEAGEDVTYFGVTYKGGKGGSGTKYEFKHVTQSLANGGAGGYGAQAYADGLEGGSAYSDGVDLTPQSPGYKAYEITKQDRGHPPKDVAASKWRQIYSPGDGGDAGQGGAGRGGFGGTNDIFMSYTDPSDNKKVHLEGYVEQAWQEEYGFDPTEYHSANGSAGKNGAPGIVICYADQPMESYAPQYEAPVIQYDGYEEVTITIDGATFTALQMNFSWNNVGAGSYLFQYHLSNNGGYSWFGQDRRNLNYVAEEWTEVEVVSNDQSISEYIQLVRGGILVEARVIALGDSTAAESEPSNKLMECETVLESPTYNAPKLKAALTSYNGKISIGLFSPTADYVPPSTPGSYKYQTVFRKTENDEYYEYLWRGNFSRLIDLLDVETDVTYNYKSAYLLSTGHVASPFSDPTSIMLPSDVSIYDTKLLPPAAIDGRYIQGGYSKGGMTCDIIHFVVGKSDSRADRVEIWHENGEVFLQSPISESTSVVFLLNVWTFTKYDQQQYIYRAVSVDSNGLFTRSDYSTDSYVINIPANKIPSPTVTDKSLSGTQLTFSWDEVEHARAYKIGRWDASTAGVQLYYTAPANMRSITVTISNSDISGSNHFWVVQAIGEDGYIDSQFTWVSVPVS